MSSSTSINYIIRPNKNVERKLIFQLLKSTDSIFQFSDYQYIGFGGFVFSDFILAHKSLGIPTLFSMESEAHAFRANFNKPYKCITVIGKESTDALKDLDVAKPSVVWLDYDTGIQGPAMEDSTYLSEKLLPGSFLFVTLNASPVSLERASDDERKVEDRRDQLVDNLQNIAGDAAPTLKIKDISSKNLPSTLASILFTQIKTSIVQSSRDGIEFLPLAFFSYKDGAQMISIGGVFVNPELKLQIEGLRLNEKLEYISGEEEFKIEIPSLTTKEKIHLDTLLPSNGLDRRKVSRTLKFDLSPPQIKAYELFYREYPVFTEVTN